MPTPTRYREERRSDQAYDSAMAARDTASKVAEIAVRAVSDHMVNKNNITAAGITYFALISIFPLALVALSVAGFFFSSEADQEELLDSIMSALPLEEGDVRDNVADIVHSVVDARGTLGLFGIISALYTGSALFTAVRAGLNLVFRGEKSRPFVIGKLVDVGMVFVFGLLLSLSTAASFVLAFVGRFAERIVAEELEGATRLAMGAASIVLALALSFFLFLLLYTRVPATNVTLRNAIPGALLAAILFEALKTGFAQYAANFGNYNATYGSLGFVILLLAFIYFTSQVMLLGAETAHSTTEVRARWPIPPAESRVYAMRVKAGDILDRVRQRLGRSAPKPTPAHMATTPQADALEAMAPELPLDAATRDATSVQLDIEPSTASRVTVVLGVLGVAVGAAAVVWSRVRRCSPSDPGARSPGSWAD